MKKNLLSKTGLRNLALGGLSALAIGVSGCDTEGTLTLAEEEIEGPVRVRVTKKVNEALPDYYQLEILDSKGKEKVVINNYFRLDPNLYIEGEERVYYVHDGTLGYKNKLTNKK